MPNAMELCATLAARALVKARRPRDLGCLAEDLPPFDPETLAASLVSLVEGPLRLALLGYPGGRSLARRGLEFTTSETTANTWRNDTKASGGTPLFVVVQGTVSKLKSLQSALTIISDRQLRALLAQEAISWSETPARQTFWSYLARRPDDFSITALLEFAAVGSDVVRRSNRVDLPDCEAQHLHLLGLIPDRKFWQSAGEKKIAAALSRNAAVAEQLRLLTRNDRRLVAAVAEGEGDLAPVAQQMLAFHRTKRVDVLKSLDFAEVARVLTRKAKRKGGGEEPPAGVKKPRPMKADEAGFRDVIEGDGKHLKDIQKTIRDVEEHDDEDGPKAPRPVEIDGGQVIAKPMSGSAQGTVLFQRLTTADFFGGIVRAEAAPDAVGCIKMLEAGEAAVTEFSPRDAGQPGAVEPLLEKAVANFGMSNDVVGSWRAYVAARARLMPIRDDLVACPLITLLDEEALRDAEQLVEAYAGLMDAVQRVRDEISKESPASAHALVSGALALDVVMLQYRDGGRVALASPLHPFHLWRYTQIARIVLKDKQALAGLDDDQVRQFTEPVVTSPHLVVSNYLDHSLGKPTVFIGAGALGYLPLYADPNSRVATQLRASGLGKNIEKLLRAAGYAQFGLDVVFVDPPSLADVLDAVLSVNRRRDRDQLVPIHVRVFRTRPSPSTTDEEEDEMEELAEALRDCAGTLDVDSELTPVVAIAKRLEEHQAHYTVFFEPGDASAYRLGADAIPRRSPLLLPRHYAYDRMEDRFDVHVSGDGAAFGAYYNLFYDHLHVPRDSAIGRRSGAQAWRPELARAAKHTMWLSVIDQDVEPTFGVDGAVCLGREVIADRDLLTFTSHADLLDRSLHHLVEEAGLPATDGTRARAHTLFRRLGGNLLSDVVGRAAPQQCVGMLGVLGVVDWHMRTVPDAILATLDSAGARAWILGAVEGDNRRGDLLCLRQTRAGLRLDVIEVKTREDERAVLQVSAGKLSGAAPEQIDNTIRALRRILAPSPDILDCTRREVLKDQLYQAVASQELTRDQRRRAVAMLEEFFREGPQEIGGRVFLVHLEPGARFRAERVGRGDERSPAGNPIEAYRLSFGEVDEQEAPPETSPEPPARGRGMGGGQPPPAKPTTAPPSAPPTSNRKDGPTGSSTAAKSPEQPALLRAAEPVSKQAEPPPAPPDGVCVTLGTDPLGKPITWDTTVNPAFGILVTGDTGFGKTQTLLVLIAEVRAAGLPVLIFDYKPDYTDAAFVEAHGLEVYDVKRRGLPFNPLALMPDKNGEVYPYDQIYELAEIFRRVLTLGEQQENRIVEAQAAAYRAHGWDPQKYSRFDEKRPFPTFAEVMTELEGMEKDSVARTTYTRLKKFLDMNLFPAQASEAAFDGLLSKSVVLAMNELPKELANTLSEMLVVKLHGTLRRGAQPRKLRRLLVFDEAWRVSGNSKLTELAREGRAFGVGLAIGTQNPSDLPQEFVSCLRTQVFLCNKDPDNQKAIARAVCGQASGREAQRVIEQVKNLAKYQGIIISEQYKDGTRVNVLPYHLRSYGPGPGAPGRSG